MMFHVFAGDTYYPGSGLDDYRGAFENALDARRAAIESEHDWWCILATGYNGRLIEVANHRHPELDIY